MENLDLSQALKTATNAALRGREVLLHYFGKLKQVQTKGLEGLVSEADLESEKVISVELAKGIPGIGIFGEEETYQSSLSSTAAGRPKYSVSETSWVVDPLDGTTNYVHGFPIFCISIGLQWRGELVVGVVDVPLLQRTYSATKGAGAFVNGERMSVSRRTRIADSLLATGFYPNNSLKEQLGIFSDLIQEARGIRRAGAAAYDLCLVAEGVFDAFWEKNLKPWDTAAGALMVREAGGIVITYSGQPFALNDDSILAGNPTIAHLLEGRIRGKKRET